VLLQIIVLADGTVGDAEVMRCVPHRLGFENVALQAVRQWRYEPALRDGEPVDVYHTVLLEIEDARDARAPATPPPEPDPAVESGLSAEPEPDPGEQPPRPLADNPRPDYPRRARKAGIEGSVTFSARIDAQGRVTEVTIHDVPAPGFGFEQSVRETVSAWRFEPARREGRPTPAEYIGSAGFFQHLDPDRARMYDLPAQVVWTEMLALLKELGIKARWHSIDEESGLVVTNWTRFKSGKFDRPIFEELPEGQRAIDFKLNIYIPRVSEPARVYIDSTIRAHVEQGYFVGRHASRVVNNIFSAGVVEAWLFGKLEARLQQSGVMIPSGYARRRELASTLVGSVPDERCARLAGDQIFVSGIDGVTRPEDLWPSSRDELRYPVQMIDQQKSGRVTLFALISPDGRVDDLQFVNASDKDLGHFVRSALANFYSWRFKPAIKEGCPVPAYLTFHAEFRFVR
jgi:TonB family protein